MERNTIKQIKKKPVEFNLYFKITKPKTLLEEMTRIQPSQKNQKLEKHLTLDEHRTIDFDVN